MSTLLDKAREAAGNRRAVRYTDEHIELALAWAMGEVTNAAVSEALGISSSGGGSLYNFLAMSLREAVRRKQLVKP